MDTAAAAAEVVVDTAAAVAAVAIAATKLDGSRSLGNSCGPAFSGRPRPLISPYPR